MARRIVDQATRLFAARGFVGASLRDIAKAVGIRKPSLLYHFPTKDELRQRVLEDMLARWNEVLPRIMRAATSGEAQFDAVTEELIAFFSRDPDRARLLLREVLDRPDEMKALIRKHVRPWSAVVCDYIRKGQAQGRIRADVDAEAYVVQVVHLVVCGVATHPAIGSLLDDTKGRGAKTIPKRHVDELLRMAKSSLFVDSEVDADLTQRTRGES